MGIAPYKTFTFDGKSSADYGVYITGEDVFNAPDRAVEMIEIPHRNGAYALDGGRFENISVTYKVGIVDDAEKDFADRVSDFRNWLCSKVGYCRLEDEYNPDEYRMAVYKTGLDVDHDLLIAGEAEVTFDCKPQRWLKSGEIATSITSGDALTNPTRFEAHPLLEVEGLGDITIGSQTITIHNVLIGKVTIAPNGTFHNDNNRSPQTTSFTFDDSLLNGGDEITLDKVEARITWSMTSILPNPKNGIEYLSGSNLTPVASPTVGIRGLITDTATFSYGTSSTFTATASCRMTISNTAYNYTYTIAIAYDGADGIAITVSDNASLPTGYRTSYSGNTYSETVGDSTKSALGNPIYIDLDIGEAWNEDYGTPVSINSAVTLGADLPKLSTGATTITYDNTITDLKVAARWWKV